MGINVSYIEKVLADGVVGFSGKYEVPENFKDIKLVDVDSVANENFGMAISMSENYLVVGIPSYDSHGSAFIFIRNENTWELLTTITAPTVTENENFGYSVSNTDELIVIGTNGTTHKAYSFTVKNKSVTYDNTFSGSNSFGSTVCCIDNTIFISDIDNNTDSNGDELATSVGAVYVYYNDNNNWTNTQKITIPGSDINPDDQLGNSIDYRNNIIAVSSINRSYDNNNSNYIANSGEVYILSVIDGNIKLIQTIVSQNRYTDGYFGNKVMLINNNTLLISDTENVYVYSNSSGQFLYTFTIYTTSSGNTITDFDYNEYFIVSDTSGIHIFTLDLTNNKSTEITNTLDLSTSAQTKVSTIANQFLVSDPTTNSNTGSVYYFTYETSSKVFSTSINVIGSGNNRNSNDMFGSFVMYNSVTNQILSNAPNNSYDENEENYIENSGAIYVWNINSDYSITFSQKIVSPNRETNTYYGGLSYKGFDSNERLLAVCNFNTNFGGSTITLTANNPEVDIFTYSQSSGIWTYKNSVTMTDYYSGYISEESGNYNGVYIPYPSIVTDGVNIYLNIVKMTVQDYDGILTAYPSNYYISYIDTSVDSSKYNTIDISDYVDLSGGILIESVTNINLSIDNSGTFLAIGIPQNEKDSSNSSNNEVSSAGNCIVYKMNTDRSWSYYATLSGWGQDRNSNDSFGNVIKSVGNYLYVSATGYSYDINSENYIKNSGLVYVYNKQEDGSYNLIQKIQSNYRSSNTGTYTFGSDIEVTDNGNTLFISNKYTSNNDGWVEVFAYNNNQYTFSQYIGTVTTSDSSTNPGSILYYYDSILFVSNLNNVTSYVYTNNSWSLDNTFTRNDITQTSYDTSDSYGYTIKYSNNLLVISAPTDNLDENGDNSLTNAGSVYIYQNSMSNSKNNWTAIQKLSGNVFNITRQTNDQLGSNFETYNDYIIVSSIGNSYDVNGQNYVSSSGSVYVFLPQSDGTLKQIQKITENTRISNNDFGMFIKVVDNKLYILSKSYNLYEYIWNTNEFVYNQLVNVSSINGGNIVNNYNNLIGINENYMSVRDSSGVVIYQNQNGSWVNIGNTNTPTNSSLFPNISYSNIGGWNILTDDNKLIIQNNGINTVFELDGASINYLYQFNPITYSYDATNSSTSISNVYVSDNNLFYTMNIGSGYVLVYDFDGTKYTFSQKLSMGDITGSLNNYLSSSTLYGNNLVMDSEGNLAVCFPNASYTINSDTSNTAYNNAGAVTIYKKNGTKNVNNQYASAYTSDSTFTVPSNIVGNIRFHVFGDCGSNTLSGNYVCFEAEGVSGDVYNLYIGNKGVSSLSGFSGVTDLSSRISGAATVIQKNNTNLAIAGGSPSYNYNNTNNYSNNAPASKTFSITGGAGYKYGSSGNGTYSGSNGLNYVDDSLTVLENFINYGNNSNIGSNIKSLGNLGSYGAVYIEYVISEEVSNFDYVQDITPQNTNDYNTSDQFGMSLDINNNLLVISAPNHRYDANGNNTQGYVNAGAAWIYQYSTSWKQVQKIVPTGNSARNSNDYFGSNCKIFNGMVVVSSANHKYDANGNNPGSLTNVGAAWVWANQDNTWTQIDKLSPIGVQDTDSYGHSIDYYNDYIAVGSPASCYDSTVIGLEDYMVGEYNYMDNAGSVYLLSTDNSGNFSYVMKIVSPNRKANNQFGWKVKFNQSSGKLYVSEPGLSTGGTYITGTVYEYTLNTTSKEYELSNTIVPNTEYTNGLTFTPYTYGYDFDIGNNILVAGSINAQVPAGVIFADNSGYIEYTSGQSLRYFISNKTYAAGDSYITLNFFISENFSRKTRLITEDVNNYIDIDLTGTEISLEVSLDGTTTTINTGIIKTTGSYTLTISYQSITLNTYTTTITCDSYSTVGSTIIGPNNYYTEYDKIVYVNASSKIFPGGGGYVTSSIDFTTSITPSIYHWDDTVDYPCFYELGITNKYFIISNEYIGSVYAYDITNSNFIDIMTGSDYVISSGTQFGYSVSIDTITSNIVVGFPGDGAISGSATSYDTQANIGSAYVYEYNSTNNDYTFTKRIGTYGNDQYYPVSINSSSTSSTTTENIYYNGYLTFDNNDSYIKYNGPVFGTPMQYGINITVFIPANASNKTRLFTQGTTYIDIDCTSSTPVVSAHYMYGTANTSTSISSNASKGTWWWIDFYYWTGNSASNLRVNNSTNTGYVAGTSYSNQSQAVDFYIGPNSVYDSYDELVIGGIALSGNGGTGWGTYSITDGARNYFDDYYVSNIGKDTAYTPTHPPANISYIEDHNVENYTTTTFQQVIAEQTVGLSDSNGNFYNGIEFSDSTGYVKYSAPVIGNYYSGNCYGIKIAILIPAAGGSNTTRIFSQPDTESYIDIALTSTGGTISGNFLGKTGSFTIPSTALGAWGYIWLFATNNTYFGFREVGTTTDFNETTISGIVNNSQYSGKLYDTYIGNNSQYSTIDNIIVGGFEYMSYYPDPGTFNTYTNSYLSLQSNNYSVPELIDYTQGNTTTIYNGFPVYKESKDIVPSTSDILITQAQSISTLSTMSLPSSSTNTITTTSTVDYSVSQQNDKYMIYSYITDSYDYMGNNNLTSAGAVHIWTYDSTDSVFKFTQRLTSPNREENGNFGNNIILRENSLLVTASGESSNNIYIYKPTGTSPYIWELSDTINLSSYNIDKLGSVIDYDETNNQIVIGDPTYSETSETYGRVIIASKTSDTWSFTQLTDTTYKNSISDLYGQEVKINGNNLIIKSNNNLDSEGNTLSSDNSLYIYNNKSGSWTLVQKMLPSGDITQYHSYTQGQESSIELTIPEYQSSGTGLSLTVYISSSCGYKFVLLEGNGSNSSPQIVLNQNQAGNLSRGSISYVQYTSSWHGIGLDNCINFDGWNTINVYNNSGTLQLYVNGNLTSYTTIQNSITNITLSCNRHVILGGAAVISSNSVTTPYTTSNSNSYIDFSDMSSVSVVGDTSLSITTNNLVDNKVQIDIPQKSITESGTNTSTSINDFNILDDTRLITSGTDISVYSQNSTTYEYSLSYSSDYSSNNLTLVDTYIDRTNNTIWNNYYNSGNTYHIDCSDIGTSSFTNTYAYVSNNNFITSVYSNYCITGLLDANNDNTTQTLLYRDITNETLSTSSNIIYNGTNGNQNTIPTILTYSNYILEDQLDDLLYSDFYRYHVWGSNVGSTQTTPNTSFYQNIGKYVKIYNDKIFTYCESDTYDEKGNMTGYFGNTSYGGGMWGNIGSVINLYKGSDGNYRYGKKLFGNLSTPTTDYSNYNIISWFFGDMIATDTQLYLSLFHATTSTPNSSIGYLTYPATYRQDAEYSFMDTGIQYSSPLPWSYSVNYKTYNSGDYTIVNDYIYFSNWIENNTDGLYYSNEVNSTWSTIQKNIVNLMSGGKQSNMYFGANMSVIGNNLVISASGASSPTYIGSTTYSTTGSGIAYVYNNDIKLSGMLGTNQVSFGTIGTSTWVNSNNYGLLTTYGDYLTCSSIPSNNYNTNGSHLCIIYKLDTSGNINYVGWQISPVNEYISSPTWYKTYITAINDDTIINSYGYSIGNGTNASTDRSVITQVIQALPLKNKNITYSISNGNYSFSNGNVQNINSSNILTYIENIGSNYYFVTYSLADKPEILDIRPILNNSVDNSLAYITNQYFPLNYNLSYQNEYFIYNTNENGIVEYINKIDMGPEYTKTTSMYCNDEYLLTGLSNWSGLWNQLSVSDAGSFTVSKYNSSINDYIDLNQYNGEISTYSFGAGNGAGYYGGYFIENGYSNTSGNMLGGTGGVNYAPAGWDNLMSSDDITAPVDNDTDKKTSGDGGAYSSTYGGDGYNGLVVITDSNNTKTVYNYIGSDQTYVVPSVVTSITIKMWGAGGGCSGDTTSSGHGGPGGYVGGTLAVSGSQIYTIMVGAGGYSGTSLYNEQPSGNYNYGGGSYGYCDTTESKCFGSGGGKSQISLSGNIIAIAAGGGGGSLSNNAGGPALNEVIFYNKGCYPFILDGSKYNITREANDYFGNSTYIIDKNNILVSAYGHQYDTNDTKMTTQTGCVWKYTLTNELNGQYWDISNKYIGPASIKNFGYNILSNNSNIYVTNIPDGTTENNINITVSTTDFNKLSNYSISIASDFNISTPYNPYKEITFDNDDNIIIGCPISPYVNEQESLTDSGAVNVYEYGDSGYVVNQYIYEEGLTDGRLVNDGFGSSVLVYNNYAWIGFSGRRRFQIFKDNGTSYDFVKTVTPSILPTNGVYGKNIVCNNGVISCYDGEGNIINYNYTNNNFVENSVVTVSDSYNTEYTNPQLLNSNTYIFGNPSDPRGSGKQPVLTNAGTINVVASDTYSYYTVPGISNGSSSTNDYYGKSVRFLNSNLFVVGAPGHVYDYYGNSITNTGSIYTYNINNGVINQEYIISNPYTPITYVGFGTNIKRVNDTTLISGNISNTVSILNRVSENNWNNINTVYVPVNGNSDIYYDGTRLFVTNPINSYISSTNSNLVYNLQTEQGGIVWYTNNSGTWTQNNTYVLDGKPFSGSSNSNFGYTVKSIKNRLVVSAPNSTLDVNGNTVTNTGNIYTYSVNNGNTSYLGSISNSDYDQYGIQFDLSKDENTLVVSGKIDTYNTFDIINVKDLSLIDRMTTNSTSNISSVAINDGDIISVGCQTYENNTGIVEIFTYNTEWKYNTSVNAFINPTPYNKNSPDDFVSTDNIVEGDKIGGNICMNGNIGLAYSAINNSTDQQGNSIAENAGAVYVVDLSKHIK